MPTPTIPEPNPDDFVEIEWTIEEEEAFLKILDESEKKESE